MPAASNKIVQKYRDRTIIEDYLKGLNYNDLAKKYKLSKSTISSVLNKEEAKAIAEATYHRRVALLPKAFEVEEELLQSDNENIRLKVMQKLFDDTGIGRTDTPYALFQSIVVNQLNPEARRFIESKAGDLGQIGAIDADFEEIND